MNEIARLTYDQKQALYNQFLSCIDREENLIHYRMTWGMQWNLACLAALVAFETANFTKPIPYVGFVIFLISFMGGFAGIVSLIGVLAAHAQTQYLIKQLEIRLGVQSTKDWNNSDFFRPFGQKNLVHMPARWAAMFFPVAFILFWFAVVAFMSPNAFIIHVNLIR